MRELMRHRDFRLLMIGQTLSMFGDTAMLLTLGMWAKDLSDSNAIAGSVFVALGLPTLLAPLGGVIIDRFRRRHVMISVDLVTAIALLALFFVHDRGDLWIIYAVAAIYTPILRVAVICVVVTMLALGLAESVFFAVVDEGLHKPVTFLGILQSAMGVGAIAGGVLITLLIPRTGEKRPVAVGLALVAVGAAMSMAPSALVVAMAMLLIGAGRAVTARKPSRPRRARGGWSPPVRATDGRG